MVKDYKAGETIIEEETDGEELFIILSGKVRLHKDEAFITHLERGAHFGEMALVDRSPALGLGDGRRAEPRADAAAARLLRDHPQGAGAGDQAACGRFVQVLTERLRKTTADLSGARLEAQAVDLSEDVLFEGSEDCRRTGANKTVTN